MKTIGSAKFKEQCLALLDELDESGLVVTKHGKPVAREGIARCGNVTGWRTRDFVGVKPGEVFRCRIPVYRRSPAPGKYRVRLTYTAKRDLSIKSGLAGENAAGVKQLMKNVWEGVLHSNWIDLDIRNPN